MLDIRDSDNDALLVHGVGHRQYRNAVASGPRYDERDSQWTLTRRYRVTVPTASHYADDDSFCKCNDAGVMFIARDRYNIQALL